MANVWGIFLQIPRKHFCLLEFIMDCILKSVFPYICFSVHAQKIYAV